MSSEDLERYLVPLHFKPYNKLINKVPVSLASELLLLEAYISSHRIFPTVGVVFYYEEGWNRVKRRIVKREKDEGSSIRTRKKTSENYIVTNVCNE